MEIKKLFNNLMYGPDPDAVDPVTPTVVSAPAPRPEDIDLSIYKEVMEKIETYDDVFSKFYDMYKTLLETVKDEKVAYQAAFKAINKTEKISVQDILLSIDRCSKGIVEEQQAFAQSVQEKNEDIESLKKGVKSRENQIVELTDQMEALTKERQSLQSKISADMSKIESVAMNFKVAIDRVTTDLNKMKDKVASYLK